MKKIIALVLLAAMALTLVACGAKTTETTETKPTLTMGTNAHFAPYEFRDENDKIVGIDAEIAQAVADKIGMTLEIKDMDFDSLLTAVQGGSIDIVLAGLTVTEERKQAVNFSDSYATGIQAIIVPENSTIATADDLKGNTIGVQSGTTGDIYCTDDFGAENVKQYKDGPSAVAALLAGQVNCVVIDNEPAKNLVAANAGLKLLETAYTEEQYAAAINKDNKDLLEKFNKALSELKADGTINKIVEKYIPAK